MNGRKKNGEEKTGKSFVRNGKKIHWPVFPPLPVADFLTEENGWILGWC